MATSKPVRKAAASKVGVATQAAGVVSKADVPDQEMPRSGKLFGADAKRIVGYGKPAKAAAPAKKDTRKAVPPTKANVAAKIARMNLSAPPSIPRLGKPVPTKAVKAKPVAVKYKGIVIPVKRKNGGDESDVPTIQVKNVNETMKVFALLPKGCTWLADGVSKDTMSVYNSGGALIAELRTTLK